MFNDLRDPTPEEWLVLVLLYLIIRFSIAFFWKETVKPQTSLKKIEQSKLKAEATDQFTGSRPLQLQTSSGSYSKD
ncbi:MAG: hypothetical protein HQM10_02100 [Candidatus Riflebacteria bacterium]|nr:hypothetical protein [Candidatus Riflebacteria bacterium]